MEVVKILLDILKNYGGEILIAFVAWLTRAIEKPKSNARAIASFVSWAKTRENYDIKSLFERFKAERAAKGKKI